MGKKSGSLRIQKVNDSVESQIVNYTRITFLAMAINVTNAKFTLQGFNPRFCSRRRFFEIHDKMTDDSSWMI